MDPATGTFTTMDTYGGSLSDPMSLHKYLFANSNPVMYSDPSGHYTMTEQMLVCGLIGELASSTLYLVELFTTDNIQYESVFHAAFGAFNAVISGFAIGVVFCALHIVFAAIVGTAIASIVFGSFGAAMSILGIADGFLDCENGDSTLGSVKVLMSIISLVLSVTSILSGLNCLSNSEITNNSNVGPKDKGQTVYRSMKEDNGMPEIGNSARSLGARPGYGPELDTGEDILVDTRGNVHPNEGGISTAPTPEDLPDFRRPPEFGGTGKDPVWKINTNELGPDLKYVPDSSTHGTIQPNHDMSYIDYQNALARTQPFWRIHT